MQSFSVIFCGTPEIACPFLQALHDDPTFDVQMAISQTDKPVGRKKEITPPPVKILAEKLNIPIVQPEDINTCTELMTQKPDYLVVIAYGQKISPALLSLPKIAPINVHFSLLPKWRGASPVQNSLISGERETGVTVFRMVEEIDAGPVYSQETVLIDPRETKKTLSKKFTDISPLLLINTLKDLPEEKPQDDSKARFCNKLTRSSGHVDPGMMTAQEIDRYVRALVPWPGVRTSINGSDVKLIETALDPHTDALELSCAVDSTLYITKMQTPGRNIVTGVEWGRGN